MEIPKMYQYLKDPSNPLIVIEGVKLFGIKEFPGNIHNPEILLWATELGILYDRDEIPWCGLLMAIVCKRANKEIPRSPLWALNWQHFGEKADVPMLGDVLVFKRKGGGHVGIYVGEDKDCYHVLGGNQGDKVSVVRIKKDRLFAARRPKWKVSQPLSVRPIILSSIGTISGNEG